MASAVAGHAPRIFPDVPAQQMAAFPRRVDVGATNVDVDRQRTMDSCREEHTWRSDKNDEGVFPEAPAPRGWRVVGTLHDPPEAPGRRLVEVALLRD